MSGAMFTHLTGTDILHIPYQGSAPAVTEPLAVHANTIVDTSPSPLSHYIPRRLWRVLARVREPQAEGMGALGLVARCATHGVTPLCTNRAAVCDAHAGRGTTPAASPPSAYRGAKIANCRWLKHEDGRRVWSK